MITRWEGDYMVMEVRNTLREGDVLEFLPPISEYYHSLEPIRIRLYEFMLDDTHGTIVSQVNPGQKQSIRIHKDLFHAEDLEHLKLQMPVGTVARAETITLTEAHEVRTQLRSKSHKAESGKIKVEIYDRFKEKNHEKSMVNNPEASSKKPRDKDSGCCGRGCNGCLVFWHDDKYAKAREIIKTKKQGVMLDKKFIDTDK